MPHQPIVSPHKQKATNFSPYFSPISKTPSIIPLLIPDPQVVTTSPKKHAIINNQKTFLVPWTKFSIVGIDQELDDEYASSSLPLSAAPPPPTAGKANISHPLLEITLADTKLDTLFQEKQNETEVEEVTPISATLTPTMTI